VDHFHNDSRYESLSDKSLVTYRHIFFSMKGLLFGSSALGVAAIDSHDGYRLPRHLPGI
jgi:hypothetical protein